MVVNAHGCAVIVSEQLKKEMLVMVKLVSNGRSKKGRVVLGIPLNENASYRQLQECSVASHNHCGAEDKN